MPDQNDSMSTILEDESMMTDLKSCVMSQKTLGYVRSTNTLANKVTVEKENLEEQDYQISSPSS